MLRRFTRVQLRGIAAALLASLIGAGFSAHAGLSSLQAIEQPAAAPLATGYEADDHFPGSAYYQLASDDPGEAAPAAGTTGTVALPSSPVPEHAVLDPTLRPAPPFLLLGTAQDKARALECLTTAIYYEAASEPDDGQRAVAQVILNRVRHPTFPATVCGVVYQGSEKTVCQFSFACDGAMARTPGRAPWQRAARVAAAALSGAVFAPVGMATHYHTYAVTPSWNRSLVMTGVFGAHFFHRWKGYWGTGAAFTQVYRGGEPYPGPKPPMVAAVLPVVPALPVPPPPASPAARTDKAAVQREYVQSGDVLPAYAAQSESQILDKWKDSGKPIR
ncbi:cell wall hydrolase [Sphingomonas turrisvirgatae]|uniref:Cell wall hydrolase n=1 Tax=Sphingomonas turrisvirgatae TaxID=1888892 RepID=A0A1E3LY45_9SPHN|nr:cell wall hydrolase [Sphingomonas turrisvirgatae]ODP38658.1 cell wall hydrolase [Sphingomonas turrisvirgatae]